MVHLSPKLAACVALTVAATALAGCSSSLPGGAQGNESFNTAAKNYGTTLTAPQQKAMIAQMQKDQAARAQAAGQNPSAPQN